MMLVVGFVNHLATIEELYSMFYQNAFRQEISLVCLGRFDLESRERINPQFCDDWPLLVKQSAENHQKAIRKDSVCNSIFNLKFVPVEDTFICSS